MTARIYDFNRRAEGSPHSPPSVDPSAGPEVPYRSSGLALNFDEPPEDGPTVAELSRAVARAQREGDEPRADLYQKVIDLRVRRAQVIAFPPKGAA